MEIYLVRHAEAAPAGEGGITDDADRPLTARGEEEAKRLGKGLELKGVRPGAVISSPLLRARQTADLLVGALTAPRPEVKLCDELAPGGKRRRLSRFLKDLGVDSVVLVGHQPDRRRACQG
jgi:phosphohistidine phosphatase